MLFFSFSSGIVAEVLVSAIPETYQSSGSDLICFDSQQSEGVQLEEDTAALDLLFHSFDEIQLYFVAFAAAFQGHQIDLD